MADYQATIRWQRQADEAFSDNRYSRAHEWAFDGGVVVPASASPHIVPLPYSVAENVDPEEAFVAALVVVSLGGCRTPGGSPPDREFTIAMIPDTQNYVDYTHQRDAGFALERLPGWI